MEHIILASASPRRKELLGLIPVKFEIITKNIEEIVDQALSPMANVMSLASQKAKAIAQDYQASYVIGCDTVVVLDEQILGKPRSEEDAYNMLKSLAGRSHKVCTGVSVQCQEKDVEISFCEETTVYMKPVTDEEVWAYIRTGDPMDKAGSYGIQTGGALFIEKIEGDYFNVVGLPVSRLYDRLKQLEIISL